jgi:hypothetical protein
MPGRADLAIASAAIAPPAITWPGLCFSKGKTERAMKRDVLAISGGMLGLGAVVWVFWGNPEPAPRTQMGSRANAGAQELAADPALKLVTERSPYMRNER